MDTKGMTTPQLRRLANDLAKAYQWQAAIDLMQLAIDRAPLYRETQGMRGAIEDWRPKVGTRVLKVYTYSPKVNARTGKRGHARLGAVHDGISADLTDAEILERYGIPTHWRATLLSADGERVIQEAIF